MNAPRSQIAQDCSGARRRDQAQERICADWRIYLGDEQIVGRMEDGHGRSCTQRVEALELELFRRRPHWVIDPFAKRVTACDSWTKSASSRPVVS